MFSTHDVDGNQPPHNLPDRYTYRNGGDANYSPSIDSLSSASSTSPWLTAGDGDGDEFGNQPFDPFPDDDLSLYLQNTFSPDSVPPDENSFSSNIVSVPDQPHLSSQSFFSPSFLAEHPNGFPDYFNNSIDSTDQSSAILSHQIPSDGVHPPPDFSRNSGYSSTNIPPSSAPPHVCSGSHRYTRSMSAPSSQAERPYILSGQYDHPDVFSPDSPTIVVLDKLWGKYTIDGVPASATGIVSLGPSHQVSEQDFLSLPKTGHGRTGSESILGGRNTDGTSPVVSRLQAIPSAPLLHNSFRATSHHKTRNVSLGLSLQLPPTPPVTRPNAEGDFIWGSLSSPHEAFSSPAEGSLSIASSLTLSPISLHAFEDEPPPSASPKVGTDDGFLNTEDPSASPPIVKHNVTSRAMRMASDARMRSAARFSCPICSQCLTTKGGLRNHINSHYGLKRFICSDPTCSKSFVTKWVCTRHQRTVHGLV